MKKKDGVLPSTSVDANTETSFTRIPFDDSYPEATGNLRAAFLDTIQDNVKNRPTKQLYKTAIQDVETGEKFQVSY